jgi:hypothetical protein
MKKILLFIVSSVIYSSLVLAESSDKEISACETLYNYFNMCFKSGLKPSPLSPYSTQDPEYCVIEAALVRQTTTKQERKDIKKAMPLYSKGLDDYYNKPGKKRDQEIVKLYGKEIHDFEKWCLMYCADGVRGAEFLPYSEFIKNCPEDAKSRK